MLFACNRESNLSYLGSKIVYLINLNILNIFFIKLEYVIINCQRVN